MLAHDAFLPSLGGTAGHPRSDHVHRHHPPHRDVLGGGRGREAHVQTPPADRGHGRGRGVSQVSAPAV